MARSARSQLVSVPSHRPGLMLHTIESHLLACHMTRSWPVLWARWGPACCAVFQRPCRRVFHRRLDSREPNTSSARRGATPSPWSRGADLIMGVDCQRSAHVDKAHGDVSRGSGGRGGARRRAGAARTGRADSGRHRSPAGDHVWDRPDGAVGPTRGVLGHTHTHRRSDAVGQRAPKRSPMPRTPTHSHVMDYPNRVPSERDGRSHRDRPRRAEPGGVLGDGRQIGCVEQVVRHDREFRRPQPLAQRLA